MRTHRAATMTLTAVVGFGALIGTAGPAFAAAGPANGSVIVQSAHQGPAGPQDLIPVTTTTMKPLGPGDIAIPPHVDPPVDPKGPGDIVFPGGHGDPDPCGPVASLCGPGDITQPEACTPVPGGPDCLPPCMHPRTNDAGDPCQPDPCDIARTNAVSDPCPSDPCPPDHTPRTNDAGDPCQPDPCRPDHQTPRSTEDPDCGGTTGGTDGGTTGSGTTGGGTTGGDRLPHTGADVAMELGAGLGLTGLGALLVRSSRRKRQTA
jgi:LPXTG-motif cell wall-anchored protein